MAFSKLFCVALLLIFLATEVRSLKTVCFNYTKFTPSQQSSITLQGDAIMSNGAIALTKRSGWSTGRALTKPVSIWDSKSTCNNVVSFVTSFSFVVSDVSGYSPADGLIFFLAPLDTQIPNNSSGGKLGVVDGSTAFNQFVGVEFDSYANVWDPNSAHIGINVNSLISLKTVKWNRVSGSLVTVSIMYDSSSKTLSVLVTDANGRISTVSQVVDLKAVLPEVVTFGLSATSTSGGRETHDIHSWTFNSFFDKEINLASYV